MLPELFHEVIVPAAVWKEVAAGGESDSAAQKLNELAWLRRDDAIASAPLVQAWDYGAGETAVLSLTLARTGYTAVIDDTAARNCARSLSLPVISTVGLIVLAKKRGVIAQITPGLLALRDAGLWLSDKLIAQLQQQENEE